MRRHGWIASWVVMIAAVALAAAGSCRAEGEVVARPAPGPGVEDQYDKLLGNILGPMVGAPAAGVSNPLGSAGGGAAAPGAQLSAEEWARRLVGNPQEGADTYGAVLATWLQSNPEALGALLEGEGQTPDEATLLRLLEGLPLGNPGGEPLLAIPKVYKAICAPLYKAHGEDLAFYKTLTPRARLVMTAYLGTLGKGDAMRALLGSLTTAEREALATPVGFVVGDTLEAERSRELLPLMIWAWKDEATRHGGDYPIMICWELQRACRGLGDVQVLRAEVLPWAEEVLGARDGGRDRDWALAALILGYQAAGDNAKAVERGGYWLEEGKKRAEGSYPLHRSAFYLGAAKSSTDYAGAADLFRKLIREAQGTWGEPAQVELLKLAQAHRDLTDVELMSAKFGAVMPARLSAQVGWGQSVVRKLTVQGSAAFRVAGASCDLPGARVEVGARQLSSGSRQEITVTLGALEQAGEHDGTVTLETNDPEHGRLAVPMHVEVASPLKVTPGSFFFGFVKPGETKTCTVTVTGAVAFHVKEVEVDKPELVKVTTTGRGDGSWLLVVDLCPPNATGVIEGNICARIANGAEEARMLIPYFANVMP